MFRKVYETRLAAPVERVWEFHRSAEALRLLTPPGRKIEPLSEDLAVREGAVHRMRFRQFGLPMVWEARIFDVTPPTGFTDEAARSPFAAWRHRHDFLPVDGGTLLRDTIEYLPPGGPLAVIVDRLFVSRDLDALFAFRHEVTRREVERGDGAAS